MADLRIVDAPLLSTVKGTEKIPTGGEGNFSVSVNQVADFAKLKWFLATEGYVDNAVGNVQADLNLHKNNKSNPHNVTKTQVGLGNVDNTADLDKPVSNATQSAIITANSGKADKSYVDSQDQLKADKTTVEGLLLLKADKSYVDNSLPHNNLIDRNSSGAHEAVAILNKSGENQQEINDRGGATWYAKSGGYSLNDHVILDNGDIVISTIANNTTNPNIDMTGWVYDSVKLVETVADLLLLKKSNGRVVKVIGYHSPSNYALANPFKGGATYIYDSTKSAQNYGGGVLNGWVVSDMSILTSYHFGAKGDGASDDTSALQNLIDFNLYVLKTTDIFLGDGWFRTTKSLHSGYGVNGVKTVNIYGSGRVYAAEYNISGGTLIDCDFYTGMGLNFQGVRGATLNNLTLKGKNHDYVRNNRLGAENPVFSDIDESAWVDPAILSANPNATGRYSTYAGVTLDAYSGAKPTIPYPDVVYPSFLLSVSQFNKQASSRLEFNNVIITGFCTNYINNPSMFDGNSDFISFNNCHLLNSQFGVSVGNSQCRSFSLKDSEVSDCHTQMTNCMHGSQTGHFGGEHVNLSGGRNIQIFKFNDSAYSAPITFTNYYCELLWRLGHKLSASSNDSVIVFNTGEIKLRGQNNLRGYPSKLIYGEDQSLMRLVFNDTVLTDAKSVMTLPKYTKFNRFHTETTLTTNSTVTPAQALAINATCGGIILPRFGKELCGNSFRYRLFNTITGVRDNAVIADNMFSKTQRKYGIPIYIDKSVAADKGVNSFPMTSSSVVVDTPFYGNSLLMDKSNVGHVASLSLTGLTLTLVFPASKTETQIKTEGGDVGDIIVDNTTMSVFFIESRVGNTITATLQNNYKVVSGNIVYLEAISTTSGAMFVCNTRLYVPKSPLFITTAAASPNLTNIGDASGKSTGVTGEVEVGDYIYVDITVDGSIPLSSSKITAIDTTAKTMTLSGNASKSIVDKPIKLMIR